MPARLTLAPSRTPTSDTRDSICRIAIETCSFERIATVAIERMPVARRPKPQASFAPRVIECETVPSGPMERASRKHAMTVAKSASAAAMANIVDNRLESCSVMATKSNACALPTELPNGARTTTFDSGAAKTPVAASSARGSPWDAADASLGAPWPPGVGWAAVLAVCTRSPL